MLVGVYVGTATMENIMVVPKKKNHLTYDPLILLLGNLISGKDEDSNSKRYIHPSVHSALFTIAKSWKQCKRPSIDEWIKKIWYIYTMEYHSVTRMK